MSQSTGRLALLILLTLVLGCAGRGVPEPPPDDALRTRMAQVVDADTGQPVQGALVLTVFYLWPKRGFGNFPVSKVFRDSAETFTDQDGRFTLTGPFNSLSYWSDALHIFKPDYGPWRFQGLPDPSVTPWPVRQAALRDTWDRFASASVVIDLRPLRTTDERLIYMDGAWPVSERLGANFARSTLLDRFYFFDVPDDRLTSFQALVDQGRASLGLPPRRLDGARQPR